MSVYSSPCRDSLWTFILCSALLVWTPVQGELWVIGSKFPIISALGDDVILPCHLEPMFDVQGLTVEWSKPDLKPDPSDRLSRVEYVHLYRDRKEVPDMKMASYFRRTELFMDDMKHGNISLKILNVSEEDSGRYRCFIPKLRSRAKSAIVELVVDPKYGETSSMETPLHPRNIQTSEPQDTSHRNAGRSRVAVLIPIIIVSLLVVAALAAYFSHHHTKCTSETNKHKHVAASCAVRLTHYSTPFKRRVQRTRGSKVLTIPSAPLKGSLVLMEQRALDSQVGDSNQQPQGDTSVPTALRSA